MENSSIMSEQNNGFFSRGSQEKIKQIRSTILKAIVWTLIGCVGIGIISILFVGIDGVEVVGKFIGTLLILAGAAFVSVVDFHNIESGRKSSQALAVMGIVMNIIWAFLWILAMWGVFDIWSRCSSSAAVNCHYYKSYSIMGIFTMTSTYLSVLGLFGSYTLSLYEGSKKSTIKPLKITAVACLAYEELYSIYNLFVPYTMNSYASLQGRFAALAYFTGAIWFIVMILAVILSKREKNADEYAKKKAEQETKKDTKSEEKSEETPKSSAPKTDDELRAEIEEKVRREMIEKEVRAKLEKEMAEKARSESSEK